jgi:hypothetical protein
MDDHVDFHAQEEDLDGSSSSSSSNDSEDDEAEGATTTGATTVVPSTVSSVATPAAYGRASSGSGASSLRSPSLREEERPDRARESRRARRRRHGGDEMGARPPGEAQRRDGRATSKQALSIRSWRKIFRMMPGVHHHHDAKRDARPAQQGGAAPAPAAGAGELAVVRRLGRAELGRHAHEDRMPATLVRLLETKWGVDSVGMSCFCLRAMM